MAAALAGSALGNSGTLAGAGIASVISGAGGVMLEHAGKKVHTRVYSIKHTATRLGIAAAGAVAAIAIVSFSVITSVEASTGKTLHGLVTGSKDKGTTVGSLMGSAPSQSTSPSPSPSPTATSPTATSSTPIQSPSSVTPTPASTPSTSSSPSTATNSSSPSPSPSVTQVIPTTVSS